MFCRKMSSDQNPGMTFHWIESWLVNSDPYIGLLQSLYNCMGSSSSPIEPNQPGEMITAHMFSQVISWAMSLPLG